MDMINKPVASPLPHLEAEGLGHTLFERGVLNIQDDGCSQLHVVGMMREPRAHTTPSFQEVAPSLLDVLLHLLPNISICGTVPDTLYAQNLHFASRT